MAETKIIFNLLFNSLGFGVCLLGIIQPAEGWKQSILFTLGAIFLGIKIVSAVLDLVKKKYSLMRRLQLQETE